MIICWYDRIYHRIICRLGPRSQDHLNFEPWTGDVHHLNADPDINLDPPPVPPPVAHVSWDSGGWIVSIHADGGSGNDPA